MVYLNTLSFSWKLRDDVVPDDVCRVFSIVESFQKRHDFDEDRFFNCMSLIMSKSDVESLKKRGDGNLRLNEESVTPAYAMFRITFPRLTMRELDWWSEDGYIFTYPKEFDIARKGHPECVAYVGEKAAINNNRPSVRQIEAKKALPWWRRRFELR